MCSISSGAACVLVPVSQYPASPEECSKLSQVSDGISKWKRRTWRSLSASAMGLGVQFETIN